ncbi:hypothetical protein Cni_G24002 [Canna indica]|uniref:Thioredoxin domain-containing protein n=1 Tax=Canna indica TaxID=4628 RepID=A0AAQ3KZG4_9LILI|nr:hypothetical protein Cni_G24002 [Canna indica]
MFPQIKHFLVEESSVMPSVLSRYGIHSFPSILLINGTTRLRYHGLKNFTPLLHFYKSSIGLDPIIFVEIGPPSSSNVRTHALQVRFARELITTEPYLTFGILFICLKIIIYFFPVIYSRMKILWTSHAWHLNLRVLREQSQLLEQVLRVADVKRSRSNLRLSNKRELPQRGK